MRALPCVSEYVSVSLFTYSLKKSFIFHILQAAISMQTGKKHQENKNNFFSDETIINTLVPRQLLSVKICFFVLFPTVAEFEKQTTHKPTKHRCTSIGPVDQ